MSFPAARRSARCSPRIREVAKVALIGSVPTGRAVMRAAADTVKPVMLELGGKNALIAYADADPDEVAGGVIGGMNFTWCGQSCGSTSRAFIHEKIHDAVIERVKAKIAHFKPGIPTDPATTMGAIISKTQFDRVMTYIESAKSEGATLVSGGKSPSDPKLAKGLYIEPTVFAGMTPKMRIAREEIFGPVLAIFKWKDEAEMLAEVNAVEYGLTCSIWTNDLNTAHRTAMTVEAGYVWVNEVAQALPWRTVRRLQAIRHRARGMFRGVDGFTQEKNVHIRLKPAAK